MIGCDQRTPEWFAARLGKATASRICDVVARTKSGYSASRANYRAQLVAERLTGAPTETFSNAAMQWGTDTEAQARDAYRQHNLCDVVEVGFIDHPTIPNAGASPDGLIGEDGLLEIKCPTTNTHIDTLLGQAVPTKYLHQIMWQMACTGRKWCDFATFDPRLPEAMQLLVIRVHEDGDMIAELEAEVSKFLAEVDETVAALKAKYETQLEAA